MSNQEAKLRCSTSTATKTKCQTCGHIVAKPKVRLSSIEFRRYVNNITDLNALIASKDHLTRFIRSKYKAKEFADIFLNDLEILIDNHRLSEKAHSVHGIRDIRIWILSFVNNQDSEEMELYKFLKSEYLDINETFNEFYQNYAGNVDTPLNKNQVSRVLSALGLKTEMKKVVRDGKPKCTIMLCATNDELSEIFQKNGI
jgi:hypothetical protein